MNPKRLLLALCLLCAVSVPLHRAQANGSHELVVGTGWDPTRPGDYQPLGMWEPAALIYETLVNLDGASRPVPCLATSWTVSKDARVYTFALGKGIRFHDGTPFDAAAVKVNAETLGRTNWQAVWSALDHVEVVDPLTVRFHLKRPLPLFFLHMAGSGYGIVAPSAIVAQPAPATAGPAMGKKGKAMGAQKATGFAVARAIGTGPYAWDESHYRRLREFRVTRNPDFRQGQPVFTGITWKVIPDAAARTIALEAGDIHLSGHAPGASFGEENLRALSGHPSIHTAHGSNWGTRLVMINHTRPPFDNPRVRRALRLAMDTEAINTVLGGLATVCPGPFGPEAPFQNPALALPAMDRREAMRILDAEGIRDTDGDGIREFANAPLAVSFTVSKSTSLAALVCDGLTKVGIRATIRPKERGSLFEVLDQMDFDIAVHPNIPSFYLGLTGTFHSKGSWSAHVDLPALDALLEQRDTATDLAAFRELGNRAQALIDAQDIILFAVNEAKMAAFNKGLSGFSFPPEEWVGSLQEVWHAPTRSKPAP